MHDELDKFLAGVEDTSTDKKDESNLYNFAEKTKAVEPTTEKNKVVDEDDEIPYHKNPKVLRYIDKQAEKLVAEKIASMRPEPVAKEPSDDEDPLSDVLTRLIGNDTQEKLTAIKDFKKALGGMKDEAKMEALREIQSQRDKEVQAQINAENEVSEAFDDIEDTFNVDISSSKPEARKLRNDFIDFVKTIAPKDENGDIKSYPDFLGTFQYFKNNYNKSVSNDKAKDIASRSISNASEVSTAPVVDSFKDMDKWLESLQN
jgi:hypothetical protein